MHCNSTATGRQGATECFFCEGKPQGYEPPGYEPPGYQPQGFQPPGYQSSGNQPSGFQPPGYQPPGYQSSGYQPPGNQPPGNQPPGYQPPGFQPPSYETFAPLVRAATRLFGSQEYQPPIQTKYCFQCNSTGRSTGGSQCYFCDGKGGQPIGAYVPKECHFCNGTGNNCFFCKNTGRRK